LQLKSLLTARGIPLPPADQIQKENLVSILQAADTDAASTGCAAAAPSLSHPLCLPDLEQLHTEIIEQTALLRADTIKNPVKAQALRRLTTALADMGVSSLSSHIPQSQADIRRSFLHCKFLEIHSRFPALNPPRSLFTSTRALAATDRLAISSCCSLQADLGAAEAYFYRAVHAGEHPSFAAACLHSITTGILLICYNWNSLTCIAVTSLRPAILAAPAEVPSKDLQVQILFNYYGNVVMLLSLKLLAAADGLLRELVVGCM
jgi:hypothetical protein